MKLSTKIEVEIPDRLIEKTISYLEKDWGIIVTKPQMKRLFQSIPTDSKLLCEFWDTKGSEWEDYELGDVLIECIAIRIGYRGWPYRRTMRYLRSKKRQKEFWKEFQRKLIKAGYIVPADNWYDEQEIHIYR